METAKNSMGVQKLLLLSIDEMNYTAYAAGLVLKALDDLRFKATIYSFIWSIHGSYMVNIVCPIKLR